MHAQLTVARPTRVLKPLLLVSDVKCRFMHYGVGVGVSVVGNNLLNSLQYLYVKALNQQHKHTNTNTKTKSRRQQGAGECVREHNGAVGWTGLANGFFCAR